MRPASTHWRTQPGRACALRSALARARTKTRELASYCIYLFQGCNNNLQGFASSVLSVSARRALFRRRGCMGGRAFGAPNQVAEGSFCRWAAGTANLCTKILDLRGFDSSIILILRGGILMSIRNFPEMLSQQILGMILLGRLGISCGRGIVGAGDRAIRQDLIDQLTSNTMLSSDTELVLIFERDQHGKPQPLRRQLPLLPPCLLPPASCLLPPASCLLPPALVVMLSSVLRYRAVPVMRMMRQNVCVQDVSVSPMPAQPLEPLAKQ